MGWPKGKKRVKKTEKLFNNLENENLIISNHISEHKRSIAQNTYKEYINLEYAKELEASGVYFTTSLTGRKFIINKNTASFREVK